MSDSGGGGGRILGRGRFGAGAAGGTVKSEGGAIGLDGPALGVSFVLFEGLDLGFSSRTGSTGNVGCGIEEEESAVGKEDGGRDGGRTAGTP